MNESDDDLPHLIRLFRHVPQYPLVGGRPMVPREKKSPVASRSSSSRRLVVAHTHARAHAHSLTHWQSHAHTHTDEGGPDRSARSESQRAGRKSRRLSIWISRYSQARYKERVSAMRPVGKEDVRERSDGQGEGKERARGQRPRASCLRRDQDGDLSRCLSVRQKILDWGMLRNPGTEPAGCQQGKRRRGRF